MSNDAKPYPTPLRYVPDQKWGAGYIQSGSKVLAEMRDVDGFPCQEEHGADAAAIQEEMDATGQRLVDAYNAYTPATETPARWFDNTRLPTEPGLYYHEHENCDLHGNPLSVPGLWLWEDGKPFEQPAGVFKLFGPIRGAMQNRY